MVKEISFGTQLIFTQDLNSVDDPLQLSNARTQLLLLQETLLQRQLLRLVQALHFVSDSFGHCFSLSEIHLVFEELYFLAEKFFVLENDEVLLTVFLVLVSL